jgi:hypothetical protein
MPALPSLCSPVLSPGGGGNRQGFSPPLDKGNVIKLSIRALILEETLLKKGFFQAIFPKLLKVLGKGFKGKTLFQKGFPLERVFPLS